MRLPDGLYRGCCNSRERLSISSCFLEGSDLHNKRAEVLPTGLFVIPLLYAALTAMWLQTNGLL